MPMTSSLANRIAGTILADVWIEMPKTMLPHPDYDFQPLSSAQRTWLFLDYSRFLCSPTEPVLESSLIGCRSDGQHFQVKLTVRPEYSERKVEALVKEARVHLLSFRDCSCGIVGVVECERESTNEAGFRTIHSPCDKHIPLPGVLYLPRKQRATNVA